MKQGQSATGSNIVSNRVNLLAYPATEGIRSTLEDVFEDMLQRNVMSCNSTSPRLMRSLCVM